jgi:dihydropteroate synthase
MVMESEGAVIIDIGGESTRPGAHMVSSEEQLNRTIPVLKGIREKSDILLSIDTTLALVAKEAIDAGVSIINDVSAGQEDDSMFGLAAKRDTGLVLMHRRLPPNLDKYSNEYAEEPKSDDIVQDVIEWLLERVSSAIAQGVPKRAIAIDPGLGFGKSVDQNWKIIEEIDRFTALGYPVFIGASRKSFIGVSSGIEKPNLRDSASVLVANEMASKGVQIFRVHDVAAHARVLQSQPHKAQIQPRT